MGLRRPGFAPQRAGLVDRAAFQWRPFTRVLVERLVFAKAGIAFHRELPPLSLSVTHEAVIIGVLLDHFDCEPQCHSSHAVDDSVRPRWSRCA